MSGNAGQMLSTLDLGAKPVLDISIGAQTCEKKMLCEEVTPYATVQTGLELLLEV